MPTFMVFKNGAPVTTVRGANQAQLADAVRKLAAEADNESGAGGGGFAEAGGSSSSSGGGSAWLGAAVPRGYSDITEHVDVRGLDLLNADPAFGDARGLFATTKPSALAAGAGKGKGAAGSASTGDAGAKDWVESDSDEQLMLYLPFMARVRVHTLLLTSLPSASNGGNDEVPKRPRTVHLYLNPARTLGFEEAEGMAPVQALTLRPDDWDAATGTARAELRFVKFQNVTSLVVFVVDGEDAEGRGERVRIDRLRVLGEVGEKRELGKLEKIGDHPGE